MSQPGGSCIDEKMFFLVMGSIKSATDVCLLVFPICYVMSSQLRGCLKVLVCVVFLLGGLVCIITLVRIAALVHRDFTAVDQTWVETAFAEWTSVEVNMAITSGESRYYLPLSIGTQLTGESSMPPRTEAAAFLLWVQGQF